MALTADQAIAARRRAVPVLFPAGAPANVSKQQIDAAIAAAVVWCEANVTAANASLNSTIASGLTVANKSRLVAIAMAERYGGGA